MPPWLVLTAVGLILAMVGFSGVGEVLVWIGVAVLVLGLVGIVLGRGRTRV